MVRQLFCFWQFNGGNEAFCNNHCEYCYGRDIKTGKHFWNGDVELWERGFERLGRDLYLVMSFAEPMVAHGFYDCVDLVGRHEGWYLNILTNLGLSPERLVKTRLAEDGRLFMMPAWHPLGVPGDRLRAWERFKSHLLVLKDAGVPVHVMTVWYRKQIKWFPEVFEWLDKNDFRVTVRRFTYNSFWFRVPVVRRWRWFAGKCRLERYSLAERGYLYSSSCRDVRKYGIDLNSVYGKECDAGKDMFLVKYDGRVYPCACLYGRRDYLGNLFDDGFKLNSDSMRCNSNVCGGDFGLFVIHDPEIKAFPEFKRDCFISQIEGVPQSSPVAYPNRDEMLMWLEVLKRER